MAGTSPAMTMWGTGMTMWEVGDKPVHDVKGVTGQGHVGHASPYPDGSSQNVSGR